MNILVTGAKGFIGKNLIATLNNIRDGKDKSFKINPNFNIFEYDVDTNPELLELYCKEADFVYHLAGDGDGEGLLSDPHRVPCCEEGKGKGTGGGVPC